MGRPVGDLSDRPQAVRCSHACHSEGEAVHTKSSTGREHESAAPIDQARRVQTRDRVACREMFAELALDLSDRRGCCEDGGKQQSQDSFLCLLIFLAAGIRLISSCMGRSFLSLPRPGRLPLRRALFFDWTCGCSAVDDGAPIGQTPRPCRPTLPLPHHVRRRQSANFAKTTRHLAGGIRAEVWDRPESRYSSMERGERNPSLTTIYKIADALEVRPSGIHARAEQLQAAGK